MNKKQKVAIIGAGPAGLAVAWKLLQENPEKYEVTIYEQESKVGGLSKTVSHKGFKFDLGGHRFYTKFPQVEKMYKTLLGKDMLTRTRLSRIYYNKKFFSYPLEGFEVIKQLGIKKDIAIGLSYLRRKISPYKEEKNFNQWVSNRFGDELFNTFFKSYTEKVWGMPTEKLSADWAAQRIQNFSLSKAIINGLFKINIGEAKTVIAKFHYPKHGPGMFYEHLEKDIKKYGGKVVKNTKVLSLNTKRNKIESIVITQNGKKRTIKVDHLVSTAPFGTLISWLNPTGKLAGEIKKLKFRNFISVDLIVKKNPFPDNWIYIHDPDVRVGRVQNFRNWSPHMTPDKKYTPIAFEYFTSEGDELWNMSSKKLVSLAKKEAEEIGLFKQTQVVEGWAHRALNAYPVYDFNYQKALELAKKHSMKFINLHPCGRGGLFRYNNMDHSILTGFYVAENIIAEKKVKDVWSVNDQESEYLEKKRK